VIKYDSIDLKIEPFTIHDIPHKVHFSKFRNIAPFSRKTKKRREKRNGASSANPINQNGFDVIKT